MSGDVGPEHTAKHELTKWLHKHGIGVYWEETNPWNYPTFCSHGRMSKQDDITIDEPPYIGALLSTSIDDENHPRPAVLWNEGDQNQNWEVIV